jgi:AmiR/NasT family two-component response regulator
MEHSESEEHEADPSEPARWRIEVAQATGILVAQFGIDPDSAFDKLAAAAIDNQRPVVDVAREIVENLGL